MLNETNDIQPNTIMPTLTQEKITHKKDIFSLAKNIPSLLILRIRSTALFCLKAIALISFLSFQVIPLI